MTPAYIFKVGWKRNVSGCMNLKKFEGIIAYMPHVSSDGNKMNLQVQGEELKLTKTKCAISSFTSKLLFFRKSLFRKGIYHFANLCDMQRSEKDAVVVHQCYLEELRPKRVLPFYKIVLIKVPSTFSAAENSKKHFQELLELGDNE
ncbi:hypothetical protein TTRE_0000904701 [Trichuris trichiura]|uniref:Uncharacterized protein n=1 Tax=Trichuris trichiura TaxID=36087 RepID=A0A077ZJX8_TRITR|nr:hypothetical protein TTRE_0000904701 [Trichuris trichiura]